MNGFLLIDKERGLSSFDVVKRLKYLTREAHVGHTGTLDPLATGLLVIAFGEATKLVEYFMGCDKEYEVRAVFGKVSDSYDADGEITVVDEKIYVDEEKIAEIIQKNFTGKITQIPPKYSALKIKGKRACDIMREGGDVEMKARTVDIYKYAVLEFDWPKVSFRVKCSTGTYIRSLVHDLGQILKCGGYVEELRRTKVDDFSVDVARRVKEFEGQGYKIEKYLISLEEIGRKFHKIDLTEEDFDAMKDGKTLLSKKIDQQKTYVAYNSGLLAGVLESGKDGKGIKFRKLIVRE
jgi:tRNA pseudouridine55 synthase